MVLVLYFSLYFLLVGQSLQLKLNAHLETSSSNNQAHQTSLQPHLHFQNNPNSRQKSPIQNNHSQKQQTKDRSKLFQELQNHNGFINQGFQHHEDTDTARQLSNTESATENSDSSLPKDQKYHLQQNEVAQKVNNLTLVYQKSPNWKRLDSWLKQAGSSYSKLSAVEFTKNSRGIFATQNIIKNQRVLYIPLSRMITFETSKQSPLVKKIIQNNIHIQAQNHTFMAIFLLDEIKKEDSQWKLYIDSIPKQYKSIPIFYNNHQLQLLQGSPLLQMVQKKRMDLRKQYETLCRIQPSFADNSFEKFCWIRTAVSSRIFGLTINGAKNIALVPFADMANHKTPKLVTWYYSQKDGGFVLKATQNIKKGQQVFYSYGKKSNTKFLFNYGFVVQNNNQNQVVYKVSLNQYDPLFQIKRRVMGKKSLNRQYKVSLTSKTSSLYDFLGFLRFKIISDKAFFDDMNKFGNPSIPNKVPFLSRSIEAKCWSYIYQASERMLKDYPTTSDEDYQLLKNTNLRYNERNCIQFRYEQKRTFEDLMSISKQIQNLLQNPISPLQTQDLSQRLKPFGDYIQQIMRQ